MAHNEAQWVNELCVLLCLAKGFAQPHGTTRTKSAAAAAAAHFGEDAGAGAPCRGGSRGRGTMAREKPGQESCLDGARVPGCDVLSEFGPNPIGVRRHGGIRGQDAAITTAFLSERPDKENNAVSTVETQRKAEKRAAKGRDM